jgi:hypothetical protein
MTLCNICGVRNAPAPRSSVQRGAPVGVMSLHAGEADYASTPVAHVASPLCRKAQHCQLVRLPCYLLLLLGKVLLLLMPRMLLSWIRWIARLLVG